jgi:hypothetical protein
MNGQVLAVSFQSVAELWAWAEQNNWVTDNAQVLKRSSKDFSSSHIVRSGSVHFFHHSIIEQAKPMGGPPATCCAVALHTEFAEGLFKNDILIQLSPRPRRLRG